MPTSQPRQLVILCDGTSNNVTGKITDTHVVALAEWLAAHPDPARITFYDPGVGNPGELPGATVWDQLRRTFDRLQGLAFGRGVYENMAECYQFLMQHYRPGDQIYLFGFSRGAFTARCVAGLVNQFGVLQAHMASMLPTLLHVYFAQRKKSTHWNAIASQSTRLFTSAESRQVPVHFIGVWDTVASVGLPPFGAKMTALPTASGKQFVHIRQALALDEQRLQFQPRLYAGDNGPFKTATGGDGDLVQLWFSGSHCDVGGGYPAAQAQLSHAPLRWLVNEAVACGLRTAPMAEAENGAEASKPKARTRVVNSQTCVQALWALSGLVVRNPRLLEVEKGNTLTLTPQSGAEHLGLEPLVFSKNSVWAKARPTLAHRLSLITTVLWMMVVGQSLVGKSASASLLQDFQNSLIHWLDYLLANAQFQQWQLSAWALADPAQPLAAFASPLQALGWDLLLIAAYAYALSWWTARAFARVAGLRTIHSPARPGLNALGWALPLAVASDVMEDGLSALAIGLLSTNAGLWVRLPLVLMALASVLKWVGLLGIGVLIAWGMRKRTSA